MFSFYHIGRWQASGWLTFHCWIRRSVACNPSTCPSTANRTIDRRKAGRLAAMVLDPEHNSMSTRQKDGSSQHIFSQKGRAQQLRPPKVYQFHSLPTSSDHHHLSPLHPHSIATAGCRADQRFRAFRGTSLGGGAAAASGARGADSAEEAARSASAGEGTTKLAGNLGSLGEPFGSLGEPWGALGNLVLG